MTTESPARAAAVPVIILAAGGSRRLGSPKQSTQVGPQTLLENAVRAALETPGVWPVIVVLGANAPSIRPLLAPHPIIIAENPAWEEGLASSLRAGLDTALTFSRTTTAVIFAVCDQPALNTATFQALLDRYAAGKASAVAAHYENHPGTPALLQRRHFGQLAHLTGDEGARQLLLNLPAAELALVDCPELALDVDTVEDLARARARVSEL